MPTNANTMLQLARTLSQPAQVQEPQNFDGQIGQINRDYGLADALAQQQYIPNSGWLGALAQAVSGLGSYYVGKRADKAAGEVGAKVEAQRQAQEAARAEAEARKQAEQYAREDAREQAKAAAEMARQAARDAALDKRAAARDEALLKRASMSGGSAPSALMEKLEMAKALGATPEQLRAMVLGGGGGGKPPAGYQFKEDGTLAAIPGGPADPSVVSDKKTQIKAEEQLPTIADALSAFDNLDNLVGQFGTEKFPTEGKAKLKSAYGAARDAIRVLSNSGVLNVGELPFLEERLNDPTAWDSFSADNIRAQIAENKKMLEEKRKRLSSHRGASASDGWGIEEL